MRVKNPLARLLIAAVMTIVTTSVVVVVAETPALAVACYGASCNGQDPDGRCNGSDTKTVRAMHVGDGILELRWSPSCVANWGRFTPYTRTALAYAYNGIGIWVRVTAWNPGGQSYQTAHHGDFWITDSSWSQMVDGTKAACTGVEIFHVRNGADYESQGWWWGPCY
jgi:hypothetical protein